MCLSKIIICGPLLWLVILFRDGNNFYREESISLEIIISFSLQGQVKKTKLQEAFFFHMHMLEDFLHNMWWCFLSLEQPDENANSEPERLRLKHEAASENTHRTGPETACHSSRMTMALIVPPVQSALLFLPTSSHLMPDTSSCWWLNSQASCWNPREPENSGVWTQDLCQLIQTASIRENDSAILGAQRKWDREKYAK